MLRLIYTVMLGLVGAVVVHIAVLLLVPAYSAHDAWARLSERASAFQVTKIAEAGGNDAFSKGADPLFASIACRFALGTGIAHFVAGGDVPFWSVSVYDRRGQNIYSFNDRTATDRKLDLVIATPVQMVELRKELPDEYAASIFVETEEREGIVVARAFVPDESWSGIVEAFLESAECRQE
ncbi:MAG: DUF1254 domain-containing protein [Rhizobiaceae bacterium]